MRFKRISLFLLICAFIPLVPPSASAAKLDLYNPRKTYGDEKAAINDPASRCTGADFKRMHTDAIALAQKDFAGVKKGGEASAALNELFETYKKDIDLGWQAMQEPYCGFGAFGSSAAKKSFQKTLTRARVNFTNQVKILPTSKVPVVTAVPTPVVATSASGTGQALNSDAPTLPVAPAVVAKTSVPSRPIFLTNLKRGMRTTDVRVLQDWLVAKGYLEADYATGYFGGMTEAAVIQFQLDKKLISSKTTAGAGLVGPRTRSELMR